MWSRWRRKQQTIFNAGQGGHDFENMSEEQNEHMRQTWFNARMVKRWNKIARQRKKEAKLAKKSEDMRIKNAPKANLTNAKAVYKQSILPNKYNSYANINRDDKPRPTFYNSQLGYHLVNNKQVPAPQMTWYEWARTFEEFPVEDAEGNITMEHPKINSLEIRILQWMEQYDKLLVLAFRGARKSTNGIRFAKRKILDFGWTVCYGGGDVDLVADYAIAIRQQFMENPEILDQYGYIIDDKAKNTQTKMFWLSQKQSAGKEPGLAIITSPSSAKGKSRIGGHPRLIVFDDIISDEVEGSPRLIKKISKWFWKAVRPMMTHNTKLIVIGTMKDPEDIYNEIEGKEMFEVKRIKAIEKYPNGGQETPLYEPAKGKWYYVKNTRNKWAGIRGMVGGVPGFDRYNEELWTRAGRCPYYIGNDPKKGFDGNRMSVQEFLLIRHEMGVTYFEYEYQLNAIPITKGYLKWENINWFNPKKINIHKNLHHQLRCNAFLDQAFGFSNRADWNCLGVGSQFEKEFYLHQMWVWKGGGVGKKIKMIEEMCGKFSKDGKPEHSYINNVYIESDVAQSEDARQIKQTLGVRDGKKYIPIELYRQSGVKKKDMKEIGTPKVVYKLPDDIDSSKKSKIIRILNDLDVKMEMNHIHINENIEAYKEFNLCRTFPYCNKFDPLDVLASLVRICTARGRRKTRCVVR